MDPVGIPVSLILPVKETARAKSRLAIDPALRPLVARWLALATTRAALNSPSVGAVWVVTRDKQVAQLVRELGAGVVQDTGTYGLNPAADLGRRHALAARPAAAVGILVSDLPLLQPKDLDDAVEAFRHHGEPMFVADHHGVGTTLLLHGPRSRPGIGFGGRSAGLHLRLGYRPYDAAPGLRLDLDTLEDLHSIIDGPQPGLRSAGR